MYHNEQQHFCINCGIELSKEDGAFSEVRPTIYKDHYEVVSYCDKCYQEYFFG